MIESLQNKTIKEAARLSAKKERDKTGLFLVEGWHMLEEAKSAGLVKTVFSTQEKPADWQGNWQVCTQAVVDKLCSSVSKSPVVALCCKPSWDKTLRENASRLLLLDRIQDPGNVGTLIRSALAFGAQGVVLSSQCADPYSYKTLQSTQGALFHIPVWQEDLRQTISSLKEKGIAVYGAALHHDSICLHDLQIPQCWGLMIGNEGQGIAPELLDACSQSVFIEMKTFESLNAAMAGSILLYAFQFPQNK